MTKQCNKCNLILDVSMFGARKISKDGYRNYCKKCHKAQQDIAKEKNSDKYKETSSAYYSKNKDKIQERHRDWYTKNRDRKLSVAKEWRLNNLDKIKEKSKEWRQANIEKIKEKSSAYYKSERYKLIDANKSHRRRIQKKSTSDGSVNVESLIKLREKQDNKCYHCNMELDMNTKYMVHLDHIIPLSKGGNHTIDNVVWSCRKCNLSKGNR